MCGGFREVGGFKLAQRQYECLVAKRAPKRSSNPAHIRALTKVKTKVNESKDTVASAAKLTDAPSWVWKTGIASSSGVQSSFPSRSISNTLQIIAVVGHVDNKETHREHNLALRVRNLALVCSRGCTNLPESRDKIVERAGRPDGYGDICTVLQSDGQLSILG